MTFDGKKMKLDTPLSEYGVKNGSKVHFWSKFQGPTKIFLEQFRGDKFFAIEVEMAFPVGFVKDMVGDKYGSFVHDKLSLHQLQLLHVIISRNIVVFISMYKALLNNKRKFLKF